MNENKLNRRDQAALLSLWNASFLYVTFDSRKRHDYAQYGRFDHPFDAFHEFFGGDGGFRFKFQNANGDSGQRIYHKQSITSKAYWNNILPNRFVDFININIF